MGDIDKLYRAHLQCFGTCYFKGEIWFCNMAFNGIFSIDPKTYLIKYRGRLPYLDERNYVPYAEHALVHDDQMIWFPNNCDQILIYDGKKQEVKHISMDIGGKMPAFITEGAVLHRDKVWMFPRELKNGIWVLDLKTQGVKKDDRLIKALEDVKKLVSVIVLPNGTVHIVSKEGRSYHVDLDQKRKKLIKNFDGMDIHAVKYDGEHYWILQTDHTDVYEWDPKQDKMAVYHLEKEEWIKEQGIPYSNAVFFGEQVILLNRRLKYVMRIERKEKTIKKAFNHPPGFQYLKNIFYEHWSAFHAFDIVQDKLLLYPVFADCILIYDIKNKRIEGKEFIVTSEGVPHLEELVAEGLFVLDDIYQEDNEIHSLPLYIAAIKNMKRRPEKRKNDIGKRVYDILRETAMGVS